MKSWNLWESRGSWKKSWDQEPNLQSLFFIIWGGDLSTLILIPYMMTTNCWIYWLLAIYWLDTLSWLQFLGLQPPISNVFWGQHEFQPSCLQWRVKHHRPPFFRRRCSQLLVKKIQRNWYIYIYVYNIYIYIIGVTSSTFHHFHLTLAFEGNHGTSEANHLHWDPEIRHVFYQDLLVQPDGTFLLGTL